MLYSTTPGLLPPFRSPLRTTGWFGFGLHPAGVEPSTILCTLAFRSLDIKKMINLKFFSKNYVGNSSRFLKLTLYSIQHSVYNIHNAPKAKKEQQYWQLRLGQGPTAEVRLGPHSLGERERKNTPRKQEENCGKSNNRVLSQLKAWQEKNYVLFK